jgi:DNA polymerase-3 subunit gamma/tau
MQFGMADLTHAAEIVSETLNGMSGATSPKLQLELMCAKVLVPAADQSEVGSLARIERLERRIGMSGGAGETTAASASSAPKSEVPATATAAPVAVSAPIAALSTAAFKDAWQEILGVVNRANKAAWMLAFGLQVVDFEPNDSVLTLQFTSARDLESFKTSSNAPDILRKSIDQVLGVTVKFKPLIAESAEVKTEALPVVAPAPAVEDVVEVEDVAEAPVEKIAEKKPASKSRNSKMVNEEERYGESLLREMLGAEPVEDKKNR